MPSHGQNLRAAVNQQPMTPFIGVYDVFSASLAAKRFKGIFLSGFSFSASYYGLPDQGFITWTDMVGFVQRVRTILPTHHLLVDIDDGYGDAEVAAHVTVRVEAAGASGIVIEDQKRPRRCGHLNGKQILELDQTLEKLDHVLRARETLFVVARTDACERRECIRRAHAFEEVGADAILVDGLSDLSLLAELSGQLSRPLVFNQLAGGKNPPCSLRKLKALGVSIVNYSTPCLFAAHEAIDQAMEQMQVTDGIVADPAAGHVGLAQCNDVLDQNLSCRAASPARPGDQVATTAQDH